MRLQCFGGLDCPVDYSCPLFEECGEAIFNEHAAIPVSVVRFIRRVRMEKAKAFAWEVRVKK